MAKMVITHKVEDIEKWLKFKAERAKALAHLGGKNVVDHVSTDGSNTVAVTAEVDDPKAVAAAVTAPPDELSATMQEHGVVPPVSVFTEG
jgi:protein-L-isoaspartate O-methyltransferase